MKFLLSGLGAISLAISAASAQNISTTITVTPACPSAPAADVIVTRSAVVVPSCAAGNGTKPSIITASGNVMAPATTASGRATGTSSGSAPEFTGAAGRNGVVGVVALIGGAIVGLMA